MPGNASPVDTELFAAIEAWIGREDPGAKVIPTILPGFADSRTFRLATCAPRGLISSTCIPEVACRLDKNWLARRP